MSRLVQIVCLVTSLGMLPSVAWGKIELHARVGFPVGAESGKLKAGTWAPVYVTITNEMPQVLKAGCLLKTESKDADDLPGVYTQPIEVDVAANGVGSFITYVRMGSSFSDVNISLHAPTGGVLARARPVTNFQDLLPPSGYLVLSLGSPLADLRTTLHGFAANNNDGSKADLVLLDKIRDLPTKWFGYEGVDLVVLTTSRKEFVQSLISDAEGRKEALSEWVKRGGKLFFSLSSEKDAELRAELWTKLKLELDVTIEKTPARWDSLTSVQIWVGTQVSAFEDKTKKVKIDPLRKETAGALIEAAWLKLEKTASRRVDVVIPKPGLEADRNPVGSDDKPLLVQAGVGLGKVLVAGFDPGEAPFNAWNGRAAFWRKLLESRFAIRSSAPEGNPDFNQPNGFNNPGQIQQFGSGAELSTGMLKSLEYWKEIPVVSFGWVALFILIYIGVVGPLDYFFLKKIVKRLELTWITFPSVVLLISVLAYFTAYKLKGKELRINKIDLVEFHAEPDPENADQVVTTQAQGHTWFTLFSPHIKNYTIGVEPHQAWVGDRPASPNPYHTLVQTASSEPAHMGGGGGGGAGLFSRTFEYDIEQAGVRGVPIQVWSTKSFTGAWHMPKLPSEKRAFSAHLEVEDRGSSTWVLTGWLDNRLEVTLEDAQILYQKKRYLVSDGKRLEKGKRTILNSRPLGALTESEVTFQPGVLQAGQHSQHRGRWQESDTAHAPAGLLVSRIWFWSLSRADRNAAQNSGLRELDQTWRVDNPLHEEAILIARVKPEEGATETLTQSPISATQIWFDELPGSGKLRSSSPGRLAQETYVRVTLPVFRKKP